MRSKESACRSRKTGLSLMPLSTTTLLWATSTCDSSLHSQTSLSSLISQRTTSRSMMSCMSRLLNATGFLGTTKSRLPSCLLTSAIASQTAFTSTRKISALHSPIEFYSSQMTDMLEYSTTSTTVGTIFTARITDRFTWI
jgi:hypothetical protein